MSIRKMSLALGLSLGLTGICLGAAPIIHFQGAIVEAPCNVSITGQGLALLGCPGSAQGDLVIARNMEPVVTVRSFDSPAVPARLQVRNGQYRLVDAASRPITSGNYQVTLAYP
ncbi:hypothetical protein DM828_20115 [Pseudomonas umsongensis]|jgi:type 1 fimbria pilin|nr:hypothetical protein [Pseudomonas umsongensis]